MEKDQIILLSGYPKSGTTWATRFIGHLVNCPVKGYLGIQGGTFVTEGEERVSDFVCYQSHHTYEEIQKMAGEALYKIIYIVRDPRDIIVSGAYHYPLIPKAFYGLRVLFSKVPIIGGALNDFVLKMFSHQTKLSLMKDCVLKGDNRYKGCHHSWKDHVTSFKSKDVLLIKYEDLLLEGESTSKEILNFVEISKPDEHINEVLVEQSFSKRKSEFKESNERIKFKHLRKGKTGEWKKELDTKLLKEVDLELKDLMDQFKYHV